MKLTEEQQNIEDRMLELRVNLSHRIFDLTFPVSSFIKDKKLESVYQLLHSIFDGQISVFINHLCEIVYSQMALDEVSVKTFVYCHSDPEHYSNIEIYERTDSGDILVWSGHCRDWPEDDFRFSDVYAVNAEDIIPFKGE